jgi:hypothetical protein
MARLKRTAPLITWTLLLAICGAFCPSATLAQDTNTPPKEVKPLYDAINLLRTDPAGNATLVQEMARDRDPNYPNDPFFATENRRGKTGIQHFADFTEYLKGQGRLERLEWDSDLAAVAGRGGESANRRFQPDFFAKQAIFKTEKPEWVLLWWVLFGGTDDTIKRLLDPQIKYIGIARQVENPDFPEYVIVASALKGKLFTLTDFPRLPFDARTDKTPPEETGYIEVKIPEIIPFVKQDGTLDAAWRDQANQPRIRIWRFGRTGSSEGSQEVGALDAAEYPFLAGFTEDPAGNMYVLRARYEADIDRKTEPSTPKEVEPRLYDRPQMFRLTKLDSNANELWSTDLGKDYGSAQATFSPMIPLPSSNANAGTSRIAYTTLREPVYTLVADASVVVPRNIAEKALLGYTTGPQGDKVDWLFPGDFHATESGGILTPKTPLMIGDTFDEGNVHYPAHEKGKLAEFDADGVPKLISGDTYSFDTQLYANFLAYVQNNEELFVDSFSKVDPDKLKMTVGYEQVPVIFHLYACSTDFDPLFNSRHQQAYWRAVRADNGEPVLGRNGWAMGHSFQSQLLVSDEGVITAERNDQGFVMANFLKYPHNRDHRAFVFHHAWNFNDSFSELGTLAPASDGYLLLFTSNHSPNPIRALNGDPTSVNAENEHPRDLAIVRVKKGFVDQLDKIGEFPWVYKSVPEADAPVAVPQSLFALGTATRPIYLTNYDAGREYSATRPRMVRMADGSYIAFWERWTHQVVTSDNGEKHVRSSYDSTWAMKIDENGQILQGPQLVPQGGRITRGDDAFLYGGKAAWLTGDIVEGKMVLHTLDTGLNYEAIVLPL